MSKPKAPPPEQQPRALGDEDFGEATYGRGLKAVTEAIEEVARHQALIDAKTAAAKKKPLPKKKK